MRIHCIKLFIRLTSSIYANIKLHEVEHYCDSIIKFMLTISETSNKNYGKYHMIM